MTILAEAISSKGVVKRPSEIQSLGTSASTNLRLHCRRIYLQSLLVVVAAASSPPKVNRRSTSPRLQLPWTMAIRPQRCGAAPRA